ncbi:MAG TPA: glycosidase-like protein, partial [Pseudolysinimonas sp.]|nr:glycosidase-like protein [Pseudolysinimonas sp.]
SLDVRDSGAELRPDPSRVVADLFLPGESTPGASSRSEQVIARVLAAPRAEIEATAGFLTDDFTTRHPGIEPLVRANAAKVYPAARELDDDLALVLGAAFTAEHAIEGAALCNPSVVVDPEQLGVPEGCLRVVVSLRSIGEGHISSMSFVSALIGPGRDWTFDTRALPLARAEISESTWTLDHLRNSLEQEGNLTEVAHAVLQKLGPSPRFSDIDQVIRQLPWEFFSRADSRGRVEAMGLIARSAYDAVFPSDSDLSQRVLLPIAEEERHGMEDARFVRFVDVDGTVEYRGTYTAYDGHAITSRLIATTDFRAFAIRRLTGTPARTKGMAFFPRRVGGRLLALTRSGGETISLASSQDGLEWADVAPVYTPELLWEVVQGGNCGSPIETERGWLVINHGVGPMRRYCIGAILLALDDPTRVIARLDIPLLAPEWPQREGYVPNVVYSCGGVVHEGMLWLPYGIGDSRIRVASVRLDELLAAMTPIATPTS